MSFKELKIFFFLASADIKAFGRTCLLLIGLTLFLHPRLKTFTTHMKIQASHKPVTGLYCIRKAGL